MKLSMMSYTMWRQPEHYDTVKMFELTRELGFDGIDVVRLQDMTAEAWRRMADDHGVPVVCHTFMVPFDSPDPAARDEALDEARRGIEAAVTLGAPVVMIPTPNQSGADRDTDRDLWVAGLKKLQPFAADAGVALTVENFPGETSGFVTADDVLTPVREVPGVKITFDAGNAYSGEDPAESFTRCAEHVVHAHFKDWYRRDEPEEGFRRMLDGRYYKSALIGEGDVDHRACLTAMRDGGYDGCINIEYEGNKYTPAEGVRRATDYLRGVADKIGY